MTDDAVPNSAGGAQYRGVIDWLVIDCRELQGQVTPDKVREGVWNRNASADFLPEDHHVNEVLSSLDDETRAVVAWISVGYLVIEEAVVPRHHAHYPRLGAA
jgi:hypothetical protein